MIRSYEISLWTLQDSFITVLKPSNIESKGAIQEPQMELKDDGDNTFSFKVPMYIRKENFVGTNFTNEEYYIDTSEFIENPIWYTLHDGNLLVNMRKIKVIFNKATDDEEVFEFIITKVTEEHDGYQKFCTVDCNGLVFHELGRQGYELVLSEEEYLAELNEWFSCEGILSENDIVFSEIDEEIDASDEQIRTKNLTKYQRLKTALITKKTSLNSDNLIQLYDFIIENFTFTNSNTLQNTQNIWENFLNTTGVHVGNIDVTYLNYFNEQYLLQKPYNNINYWIEKVLKNSYWDYLICMDWSIYDGIIEDNFMYINNATEREAIDTNRAGQNLRCKYKVYNKPYVSSWVVNNDQLIAAETVEDITKLEKIAFVEGNNSNRYNLLQSIAEAFEVFCKFRYLYDDNYHIIGRQVIFYNNFVNEEDVIDFNYGYNTNKISREIDSNDLVSKMYVSNLNDAGTIIGEIGIKDTQANPSLENYLLNFDYLYKINTISQEQYDEVKVLQAQLRTINEEIDEKNSVLIEKQNLKPRLEAQKSLAENIIEVDTPIIANAENELMTITAGKTYSAYTTDHSLDCIVITNTDTSSKFSHYITIDKQCSKLNEATLEFYTEKKGQTENNSNAVSYAVNTASKLNLKKNGSGDIPYLIQKDKEGLITKIYFKFPNNPSPPTILYAVFQWDPQTPSKTIIKKYGTLIATATKKKEEMEQQLNQLKADITQLNSELRVLRDEKLDLKNKFEQLMGAALREGNWQPDDIYVNYQENKIFTLSNNSLTNNIQKIENEVKFFWDSELFPNEQKLEYYIDVDEQPLKYPCISLAGKNISLLNDEMVNYVYADIYADDINNAYYEEHNTYLFDENDPRLNHYLQLGADKGCKFVFLKRKDNGQIIPALMLVGVEEILEATIDGQQPESPSTQIQRKGRISKISYDGETGMIVESQIWDTTNINFVSIDNFDLVYPRFCIDSLKFLTTTPEHLVYYGNTPLEENEDYYVLQRNLKQYITIKPESAIFKMAQKYSLHYALSTAAEALYLDAIEVMKENSEPKVSYSITPLAVDENFMLTAYNRLGQLAHINDFELKFENVQGYVSELKLDLDKPWEDSYTIKNYKTKFEDLFTSIVAQTENIKSNSQTLTMAANLFTNFGTIQPEVLNQSLTDQVVENIETNSSRAVRTMTSQMREELSDTMHILQRVMNGDNGLFFPKTNTIDEILLNNTVGLKITGHYDKKVNNNVTRYTSFFQVDNSHMGFYKLNGSTEQAMLYFNVDTGSMFLDGGIYARTGCFGNSDLDDKNIKIGTYSTTINGNEVKYGNIHSGLKNSRGAVAEGFYLGTDGFSIGPYQNNHSKFEVNTDGTLYAKGATIDGTITASSGTIGGWTISPQRSSTNTGVFQALVYNPNSNNNPYFETATAGIFPDAGPQAVAMWIGGKRQSEYLISGDPDDKVAPFRVFKSGKLEATDAVITGTITASSGTIGGFNITSSGNPNATSAQGGHKYTTSLYAYGYDNDYEYEVGIKGNTNQNSGNLAFYVAQKPKADNWSNGSTNVFYVNYAGKLYATNAEITGAIKAKSGTIGEGATNKITIGTNGTNASIYSNMSTRDNTSNNGFYLGTDGLALGQGKFKVTSEGALTATSADISGTITASSGKIGGWMISPQRSSSNTGVWQALVYNSDPDNYPYFETADAGIFPDSGSDNVVMWIGGKRQQSYVTAYGGVLAPFRVFKNGSVNIIGTITITGNNSSILNKQTNSINIMNGNNLVGVLNSNGYSIIASSNTPTNNALFFGEGQKAIRFIGKNGDHELEVCNISAHAVLTSGGIVDEAQTFINAEGDFYIKTTRTMSIEVQNSVSNYSCSLDFGASGVKLMADNITLTTNNDTYGIEINKEDHFLQIGSRSSLRLSGSDEIIIDANRIFLRCRGNDNAEYYRLVVHSTNPQANYASSDCLGNTIKGTIWIQTPTTWPTGSANWTQCLVFCHA